MTPAEFVVRSLDVGDAAAVAMLYRQSAEHLIELGCDGPFRFDADTYRRDGFGDDPAFAGIGAVPASSDDAPLAAYLLYTFGYDTDRASRHLFVLDLLVDRRHRSRGVGALLMDAARRIADERGIHALSLRVHERNVRAIRFYERLGLELDGAVREMTCAPASADVDPSEPAP